MENRIARALRRVEDRPNFVNLMNTNFHSCGLFPDDVTLLDAMNRYFGSADRAYRPDPAGLPILREAIASFYADAGLAIEPGSIIVTASASESYGHIFTGLCRRGRAVLLPRPGYPLFEEVARRCGLRPVFYDLDAGSGWRVDVDQLVGEIDERTAAVVLISPNNPTGSIVDAATIRLIGERCRDRETVLIVDEVFSEYTFGPDADLPRPAVLCPGTTVFTLNGVSKLLAAPDLKVSWIAVSGPDGRRAESVERLEVENDLYLNASPINQHAAAALLRRLPQTRERLVCEVGERRSQMLAGLDAISRRHPGPIAWTAPAGGIHLPLFCRVGLDDEEVTIALLERHSISVHPGYFYGVDEPTTLVLSYLSPPDVIREGLARIDAFLNSPDTI